MGILSTTMWIRRTKSATHRIRSSYKILNSLSPSSPEVDVLLLAMRADGLRIAIASRERSASSVAWPVVVSAGGAVVSVLLLPLVPAVAPESLSDTPASFVVAVECLFAWVGVAATWISAKSLVLDERATNRVMGMTNSDPKGPADDRWNDGSVPSWSLICNGL
jgi:hypothetical protein